MGNINASVDLRREGEVALVTVDNPPVNALKHEVRAGLAEALRRAREDDAAQAVAIACAGRTFFAGADITELGKPPQPPGLGEVIAQIEAMPKPVVAAIHGTALGGGFELALACHFRIAAEGARVGLPEVKLGLLPGAGGTQRLPRLVGPEKALRMIVTGDPIPAAGGVGGRHPRRDRRGRFDGGGGRLRPPGAGRAAAVAAGARPRRQACRSARRPDAL